MAWRRADLKAAAVAALLILAAPVHARAQGALYAFDIPAQDLGSALRTFGKATKLQLTFNEALVRGRRGPRLAGALTAERALEQLLEGTGLQAERTTGGVIVIAEAASPIEAAQRHPALAPATPPPSPRRRPALRQELPEQTVLGELVVTASREPQPLNRVPMSVWAVNQHTLDRKGVSNIYELARASPALTFRNMASQPITAIQGTMVAIRGIVSTAGSATTGVYLDDIPLQRRSVGNSGAGIPFPKVYDLERVEVLRGPQGTLYGGSSEGGAVRFITPTPSLTRREAGARASVSFTQGGAPSGDVGLVVGGPLAQDRLGFRLSGQLSRVGGYIDHVAPTTGRTFLHDSNAERSDAVRAALLWRPTNRLKIEPAAYYSLSDKYDVDSYWSNVPAYTLPAASFGETGQPAVGAAVRFTRPALYYPALDAYGPGKTGENAPAPRKVFLGVYSLTMDYDFGALTAKSITGYVRDTTAASTTVAVNLQNLHLPLWGGYSQLTPGYASISSVNMRHESLSQEIRLNSRPDRRLTWVAGLFYAHSNIDTRQESPEDSLDQAARALRGVSASVFYGADFDAARHVTSVALQDWNDVTLAVFAEGNLALTDGLKATAGVRISKERFRYDACTYGLVRGILECSATNANFISASTTASPISPKIGLAYQIDKANMVYATVARGFRTGGINTPVPNSPVCGAAVALIGGTPTIFAPDYVTSYEAGAKLRLAGGRAAIKSSVFFTDWTDLQLQVILPGCPFNYTANAGRARSQGFDVAAQVMLTGALSLDLNLAYTDARYTKTTSNHDPSGAVISVVAFKGDPLPVAPWTVDLALNYDFVLPGGRPGYARVDYAYSSPFHRTVGPGAISYAVDTYNAASTQVVNARAGAAVGGGELSLFGKNIFNSRDVLDQNGGRVCGRLTDPACASPAQVSYLYRSATFRPREIGITATYRY